MKSKGVQSVAQKMRQLNKNIRAVFDYLKMIGNSQAKAHIWGSHGREQICRAHERAEFVFVQYPLICWLLPAMAFLDVDEFYRKLSKYGRVLRTLL